MIVVIDVNDNPPYFHNSPSTNISIALPESEPVGSLVLILFVTDPDLGQGGNFHFTISDPVRGDIAT